MIRINSPQMGRNELTNIMKAVLKNEISGNYGRYIKRFEKEVSSYCGSGYGVSTSSGTAALHLALLACGVKKGHEVIIPNLTMAATAFAVKYIGAKPVPVDVNRKTWNIDPDLIKDKITSYTKAIIPVHLYGNPCNMGKILDIAKECNLKVIEDCAEALGATYVGVRVGSFGDAGCHSFYSTKMITTGEGGMITTNQKEIKDACTNLRNMAFGDNERYLHKDVGYNYRMSNLQSAIGMAQIQKLDSFIEKKRMIHNTYKEQLEELVSFQKEPDAGESVWWVNGIIPSDDIGHIRRALYKKGIDTGDVFTPMNMQPFIEDDREYPISDHIYRNGFILPSPVNLKKRSVIEICKIIKRYT